MQVQDECLRDEVRAAGRVVNSSKPGNYLRATVELGLDWDVSTTEGVRSPLAATPQEAEAGQRLLAESAGKFIPLFSRCAEEWKWKHRLFLDESGLLCVGQLSKAVQDDFLYIVRWFGKHFRTNVCTPWRITGLRLFGVRTIAVAEDDKMRPFLHEPYRTSGFLLAPIFSGFPTLKFKKRGS